MNTVRVFVIAIVLTASAIAAVEQPKLQNAKLVNGSAANLAAEVDRASHDAQPSWTAWAVPMVAGDQQMCCYSSNEGVTTNCGCSLGDHNNQIVGTTNASGSQHLESAGYFYVFLRTEAGKVQRVRTFSAECPIDADGMTVHWLGEAKAADSVAYLSTLVGKDDDEDRHDRVSGAAVMAIAFTNDASADRAIDGFLAAKQNLSVRKKAAFWTAQLRGKSGLDKLVKLMREDGDDRFRTDLTFDLSQSKVPEAETELIHAAREDSSAKVRGQALFWLAQRAGKKVAGTITEAIERDPDTDVKKRAVFALSQMPQSEGVPLLIQVAKTNTNPVVRKQAVFWLGQSHDPRALDFIESVLRQ